MPSDDQTLTRRFAKSHDAVAFETFVRRYSGLVYHVAARKGATHALAQEITQDVFVTFARKAPSLTKHKNLAGWIYGAAILTANNALRKERRHHEKMDRLQSDAGEPDREQATPHLDDALAALRLADREVIIKHYFSGQSAEEIAGASGRSAGAVRKRLARSLKKLETILKRQGIPVSVTALSGSLATELARAAPEDIAPGIIQNALKIATVPVATTGGATGTLALLNSFALSRYAGVVAVLVGTALPVVISQYAATASRLDVGLQEPGFPQPQTVAPSQKIVPQPPVISNFNQLIVEIRAFEKDAKTADPIVLRRRAVAIQLKILDLEPEELGRLAHEIPDLGNASPLYPIIATTFERWARLDPHASLRYALTREERFYSAAALENVFSSWARHDPQSALAALTKYPDLIDTDKDHQCLAPVMLAIAESDPKKALDLLGSMEGGAIDPQAVSTGQIAVLSSWATRSPDAVLAWIRAGRQTPEHGDLIGEFFDYFGRTFPEKALSLATQIERHQTREDGIMSILRQWGSADPAAAAAAYLKIPTPLRTQNLTMNVVQLLGSDPTIALDTAKNLSPGYHRNAFITQAAKGKARSSPSEAAGLVMRLPDGWARRNTAESVARAWIEQDRAAAIQWVETTGYLTAEAHRKLLQDNPEP